MTRRQFLLGSAALAGYGSLPGGWKAFAGEGRGAPGLRERLDAQAPMMEAYYKQLHRAPELSLREKRTAASFASVLRKAGYQVLENIGGYGVAGVLENGEGAGVLLRADMDALPIQEKTGLPWASENPGVMHACGHDAHLSALAGAATVLQEMRESWSGRLLIVGQPAEEGHGGAKAMLRDGLYERAFRPDCCLGVHVQSFLRAGAVAVRSGPCMAGNVFITVRTRGPGGHATATRGALNPIRMAARLLRALNTLPDGRETLLNIGVIQGGSAPNTVPQEARMELTFRFSTLDAYDEFLFQAGEVLQAEAVKAGLPPEYAPVLEVQERAFTPPVVNDAGLAGKIRAGLVDELGAEAVREAPMLFAGDDFAWFGETDPETPLAYMFVGAGDPALLEMSDKGLISRLSAEEAGRLAMHGPYFAPVLAPTLRSAAAAYVIGALTALADSFRAPVS